MLLEITVLEIFRYLRFKVSVRSNFKDEEYFVNNYLQYFIQQQIFGKSLLEAKLEATYIYNKSNVWDSRSC